jgi:FtsH-binding integral membrane protein
MGLIVVSIIFGFTLGVLFSGAMIIFAAASILYTTHRVMHEYTTGQHVAASLALFAGVALLFWYIVQILLSFAGDE